MEREQGWREQEEMKKNSELDTVPSKEKQWKKQILKKNDKGVPKKYQLKDMPVFFPNAKIESTIPKPTLQAYNLKKAQITR